MSRMTFFVPLLACASFAIVCGYAKAERKADPSQLKVGSHCEVATKEVVSRGSRTTTNYLGTVQEITQESVTLVDVSKSQRVDKSTPVLSKIPYVNRLFKTVGIGSTHLGDEAVTIPLKDIARNEVVDELEFEQRTAGARMNTRRRGRQPTGQ